MRCQALLFDLDGVLVDSRAVVERTWRRWARRHNVDPERLLRAAHGRRTRDTVQIVAPHLDLEQEVARLEAAEVDDVDGLLPVTGAARLLSALPSSAWAVVTSAGRVLARRRLECVGLPVPGVLVTSEDVARGKPDPDGYLLAAKRVGCEPSSCIAFEDAPAGVTAARAAGVRVVALTTTHARDQLQDADACIGDFDAVYVRSGTDGLVVELP